MFVPARNPASPTAASPDSDGSPHCGDRGPRSAPSRARSSPVSRYDDDRNLAVDDGNVRRIYIKDEDGTTILEIPLATGLAATVITAAFMPVLVAVGAVAALIEHVTVGIERRDSDDTGD
ncbi:DUF4342 domain-containing protein [Rhodococcoides trifolii]|uniref:DUF4342 domain-containing protein n=1 Tax=Rhodococcoides trifolii TaxID=908250 RepID=UPI0016658F3F|nr:DUF4342 domain-containing protein [Rhodococcus trifolii]